MLHASDNADGRVLGPRSFVYPPFIVLERGMPLADWAREERPTMQVWGLVEALATLLATLHSNKHVHRGALLHAHTQGMLKNSLGSTQLPCGAIVCTSLSAEALVQIPRNVCRVCRSEAGQHHLLAQHAVAPAGHGHRCVSRCDALPSQKRRATPHMWHTLSSAQASAGECLPQALALSQKTNLPGDCSWVHRRCSSSSTDGNSFTKHAMCRPRALAVLHAALCTTRSGAGRV